MKSDTLPHHPQAGEGRSTKAHCSCGVAELHVVARGYTFDAVRVELWSDGSITGRMGTYPPGAELRR